MKLSTQNKIEDLFDMETPYFEDMEMSNTEKDNVETIEGIFKEESIETLLKNSNTFTEGIKKVESTNVANVIAQILKQGKEPVKKVDYIGKYAPRREKCYRMISIGTAEHLYLDEYILEFRDDMDIELLYYSDDILRYSEYITPTTSKQIVIPKTRTWNRVDVRFSNGEEDDYTLWAESHAVPINIPMFAFQDKKGQNLNPIREINVFQTKILVNSAINKYGDLVESRIA